MGELLTTADFKEIQADRNNLPFHDYNKPLEPADIERLNREADVQLYFSGHGSDPHDFHAVHDTISRVDPAKTLVATEQFGYHPHDNNLDSRNGGETATKPPSQSFFYVQQYCKQHGIPQVKADFDSLDRAIWERNQRFTDADSLPDRGTVIEKLVSQDWLSLDFSTATEEFRQRSDNSNWHYKNTVNHRWGELNKKREQAAAQTVAHTALEQLDVTPRGENEKMQTLLFYGLGHQAGIEKQFRDLGIRFTSHVVDTRTSTFTEQTKELSPDEHQAYMFAQRFFWDHTDQGAWLNVSETQFAVGIREIPIAWLASIYESYRTIVRQIHEQPESKQRLDYLPAQLSSELYNAAERATSSNRDGV